MYIYNIHIYIYIDIYICMYNYRLVYWVYCTSSHFQSCLIHSTWSEQNQVQNHRRSLHHGETIGKPWENHRKTMMKTRKKAATLSSFCCSLNESRPPSVESTDTKTSSPTETVSCGLCKKWWNENSWATKLPWRCPKIWIWADFAWFEVI